MVDFNLEFQTGWAIVEGEVDHPERLLRVGEDTYIVAVMYGAEVWRWGVTAPSRIHRAELRIQYGQHSVDITTLNPSTLDAEDRTGLTCGVIDYYSHRGVNEFQAKSIQDAQFWRLGGGVHQVVTRIWPP